MPKSLSLEEIINRKRPECMLTVIEFDGYFTYPNAGRNRALKCICECGKITRIRLSHYLKSNLVSCGCKHRKNLIERNSKYFVHHKQILSVYHGMMTRCYNEKAKEYKYYGGRGVIVCDEWKNDYENFLKWALPIWRQGYDLDKDTKGTGKLYSPEMCVFIPKGINRGKTSLTKKIEYKGQVLSKTEICKINNINATTVDDRIRRGWSFEEAIHRPLKINQYK